MFDFHVKSVSLLDEQTKFSRWFSEEASGFGECELETGVVPKRCEARGDERLHLLLVVVVGVK